MLGLLVVDGDIVCDGTSLGWGVNIKLGLSVGRNVDDGSSLTDGCCVGMLFGTIGIIEGVIVDLIIYGDVEGCRTDEGMRKS